MRLSPFVLLLVLCAGCGDKKSGSASAEPSTTSKPTSTAASSSTAAAAASSAPAAPPAGPLSDEWKETDVEGVISLKLPGTPKKSTSGTTIQNVMMTASPSSGIPQINLNVTKLPAGQKINSKGVFDGARDGASKATNAKLVEEKDVKLGSYEGREFILSVVASGTTIISRTRVYIVGQNLVTIVFTVPEAQMNKAQADAFFDSIKAK